MPTIDLSNISGITSPHFYPCYKVRNKFQLYWGSQGSGKSWFIACKIILRILTDPQQHRVLVMRKVHAKIRDSVFNLFVQVIRSWGLTPFVEITSTPFCIRFPAFHDSEIIFSGADDPEKLKSVNAITSAWCEEITEFDADDLDQVIDRIRGVYKYPSEIFMSFNPVSEKHWIKAKFFDDDEMKERAFFHHSTWRNNPFVHPDYGQDMIKRYKNNPNAMNVRVYGIWGNDSFGGECYHKFNIAGNCRKNLYDPDLPLLLSFDFNSMPHSSVIVCQLKDSQLMVLEEITGEHPNNRPIHLCKTFIDKYGKHQSHIWVCGDSSGKADSHKYLEAGTNDYTLIFDALKPVFRTVKDCVLSKNASVVQRLEFINNVFAKDAICRVWIDETRCPKLIEDLLYIKANNEGSKLKQKVKDKKTGATYEKLGHLSDTLDYAVTTFLKDDFQKFLKIGEPVLRVGPAYLPPSLW